MGQILDIDGIDGGKVGEFVGNEGMGDWGNVG